MTEAPEIASATYQFRHQGDTFHITATQLLPPAFAYYFVDCRTQDRIDFLSVAF